MALEALVLPLFAINILLVLVDASVGFHLAPVLYRASGGDPEAAEVGSNGIRKLLTGVVVLYMFFNCLAFFRQNGPLLVLVTGLVLFDLGGQLYIRSRSKRHSDNEEE